MSVREAALHTLEVVFPKAPEREAFMVWALGDEYGTKPVSQTPELWNARHGDALRLSGSEMPEASLPQMAKLYRETLS